MNESELIEELCGRLGPGKLDPGFVLPAVRELGRSLPAKRTTAELLAELEGRPGEVFASLATHLRARRRGEAARCCLAKKAGADLKQFEELLGDLPYEAPLGWEVRQGAAPERDEETEAAELARALSAPSPEERRRALGRACAWPTPRMAPIIREACERDASLRERALLILILRHGAEVLRDWPSCSSWLERVGSAGAAPPRTLTFEPQPAMPATRAEATPAHPRGPLAKLHVQPAQPRVGAPEPRVGAAQPQVAAAEPPVATPPAASLWDEHLLPLFAANWPMLTGIAMVVAGSSVLAFYTWDKHWFFRYTLLPLILAAFTGALARIAEWMEGRDHDLKSTADMLRGAATLLLPANFMAVALLARDPQVTGKVFLVPAYALIYLVVAGRGLARWCAAVHPSLKTLLGGTLLALNALVLLGPAPS